MFSELVAEYTFKLVYKNEGAGEGGREAAEMACGKTSGPTETHSILSKSKTPIKPHWIHGLI